MAFPVELADGRTVYVESSEVTEGHSSAEAIVLKGDDGKFYSPTGHNGRFEEVTTPEGEDAEPVAEGEDAEPVDQSEAEIVTGGVGGLSEDEVKRLAELNDEEKAILDTTTNISGDTIHPMNDRGETVYPKKGKKKQGTDDDLAMA